LEEEEEEEEIEAEVEIEAEEEIEEEEDVEEEELKEDEETRERETLGSPSPNLDDLLRRVTSEPSKRFISLLFPSRNSRSSTSSLEKESSRMRL